MRRLVPLLALSLGLPAAVPVATAAESLGRLFYTPEQRSSLDAARIKRTRTSVGTEEGATEKPPAPPQPEVVTYGGMVRRSDGSTTVWLNDRALQDKDLRSAAVMGRIRPDGSLTVQSPQTGRSVDLKVGQRAELLSGTVEERYTRRSPAPKPEAKAEGKPANPQADAAAASAAARSRDDRDREEKVDKALRALEAAALNAKPAAPPAQPTPQYPR